MSEKPKKSLGQNFLHDKNIIEGVLIPSKKRITACISSQSGCSLSCNFCATGKLKRVRNLNPDEIYDQVVMISNQAAEEYNIPLSNIVFREWVNRF